MRLKILYRGVALMPETVHESAVLLWLSERYPKTHVGISCETFDPGCQSMEMGLLIQSDDEVESEEDEK